MLIAPTARSEPNGKRPDDGYAGWVVFGDVTAASIPLVVLATDWGRQSLASGDLSPFAVAFAIAPFGPAILAPIIHAAHGRRDEAWASAIGWSSSALISSGAAILLLSHGCAVDTATCPIDGGRAAAVIALSATLTVGMTIVDGWIFAHGHVPDLRASIMPAIVPVPSGATVGLGGTF
jgi:hypothetical protein